MKEIHVGLIYKEFDTERYWYKVGDKDFINLKKYNEEDKQIRYNGNVNNLTLVKSEFEIQIMHVTFGDTSDVAVWLYDWKNQFGVIGVGRQLVISPMSNLLEGHETLVSYFGLNDSLPSNEEISPIVSFDNIEVLWKLRWIPGLSDYKILKLNKSLYGHFNKLLQHNYDVVYEGKPTNSIMLKQLRENHIGGCPVVGISSELIEYLNMLGIEDDIKFYLQK